MKVKLSDVAQRAGVSNATASLAMNGSDKVNRRTRERVVALARELGYTPNPYARKLVTRKSNLIGLIVPDIQNVYYASLVHHLSAALKSSSYGLFIATSDNSRLTERKIVGEMIQNRMDALILVPVNKPNDDLRYLEALDDAGIPTLFLTSLYPGVRRPCVMCDLMDGMRRMIHELYKKGYRKIALINGPKGAYCLDLRTDGYMKAVAELGLEYHQILRLERVTYQESRDLILKMDKIEADAIVCVNDMMALGVINALIEKDVRVPEDVAVAGYDDVIFSEIAPVPITTVRQDIGALSREAADMIMKMIRADGAVLKDQQKILSCEVILKQSTP